ncbi:MAG: hypothetical protein HY922_08115 [Elusimicrobia bacterium]|nr:hypothetical protein [Elusimicrobiota bacterium]
MRGANDKASVQELESYNKKLQDGLGAAGEALGKGLSGKSLDKKAMPKLGAECGSALAVGLPSKKDASMQLEAASSKPSLTKSVDLTPSRSESAKETVQPKNAGRNILGASMAVPSPIKAIDPKECARLYKYDYKKYAECACPGGTLTNYGVCIRKGDGWGGFDFSKLLEDIDKSVRNNPFVRWMNDLSDKMWQRELEGIKKVVDGVKKIPGYIDKAQKALEEWGRKLRDETEPCGKDWYNPNKACCSAGKIFPGQVPIGKGKCGCPEGQIKLKDGKSCGKKLLKISIKAPSEPIVAGGPEVIFTAVLTPADAAVDLEWSVKKEELVASARPGGQGTKTGTVSLGLAAAPPLAPAFATLTPLSRNRVRLKPILPVSGILGVRDRYSGAGDAARFKIEGGECRKITDLKIRPARLWFHSGGNSKPYFGNPSFSADPPDKAPCKVRYTWSLKPSLGNKIKPGTTLPTLTPMLDSFSGEEKSADFKPGTALGTFDIFLHAKDSSGAAPKTLPATASAHVAGLLERCELMPSSPPGKCVYYCPDSGVILPAEDRPENGICPPFKIISP